MFSKLNSSRKSVTKVDGSGKELGFEDEALPLQVSSYWDITYRLALASCSARGTKWHTIYSITTTALPFPISKQLCGYAWATQSCAVHAHGAGLTSGAFYQPPPHFLKQCFKAPGTSQSVTLGGQ